MGQGRSTPWPVGLAIPYPGLPCKHPPASLRKSELHPLLHLPFLGREVLRLGPLPPPPNTHTNRHLTLLEGDSLNWLQGLWGCWVEGAQGQKRAWVPGQMLASVSSCVGRRGRGVSTLRRGWLK